MMNKIALLLLLLICGYSAFSQEKDINTKKDGSCNYNRFRIALHGGLGYKSKEVFGSYKNPRGYTSSFSSNANLNWGYNLGCDASYYFTRNIGFGVKYNNFRTSISSEDYRGVYQLTFDPTPTQTVFITAAEKDLSISFIGPMVSGRLFNDRGNAAFLFNLAIGYMDYCYSIGDADNVDFKGDNIGLALDLGYDIKICKNWFLGVQLSVVTGRIKEFEFDKIHKEDNATVIDPQFNGDQPTHIKGDVELSKDDYISLQHFDLLVGLRYCF